MSVGCTGSQFPSFPEGNPREIKKLYSRWSRNWRVEAGKEDKSYSYWPALIAEILSKRAEDPETATRHIIVSPTNPQHLAPTKAMRESPATENLVAARLSRFKKETSQGETDCHKPKV